MGAVVAGVGKGGVVGEGLAGEVGDSDGEFGADEEAEIEQAGPGERCMTTGERFESVIDEVRIRVTANIGRHQDPAVIQALAVATHSIALELGQIRLTARNTARPGFAEEQFHALRDEEGEGEGERKPGPALVPFPEFALDEGGALEVAGCFGAGDEEGDD